MTRTVMCRKFKQELPGLAMPPLPGERGQAIYQDVSQPAWQAWLTHQTRLINEKHLNMMDPEARKYLSGQMEKFLADEEYVQAEGYVPEEKS